MAQVPSAPPPSYDAAVPDNRNKTGNSNVAPYGYGSGAPQQQPYGQPAYGQPTYGQPAYGQPGHDQGYAPPAQQYPNQGYGSDAEDINAFSVSSFSDKVVRNRFIRKVYLILMCQLLFTFALVAVFVLVDDVKNWVRRNMWFYILAYVTFLVTYIVLACCPGVRMKYPGNYIALGVFTVMFSYVCAAIASFHNAQAVLIAAGITALVALSISLFAIQTKIDFTMCSGLMFAACMVLLLMGFAMLIAYAAIPNTVEGGKTRYYLQIVYGSIAALILCLFLVFDTQRIVGGKNRKNPVSPEEHILGAMELYLDIVYLFLIILALFGGSSRD